MEIEKNVEIEKNKKGAWCPRPQQENSGDAAVSCRLPDGSLAFILSDGMGKGMKAAAEVRLS
ncbi:MAG: hypothetical protein ACLTK0_02530 [Anaerovoracaceae bacterium]